ncbi:conserved hypothetical protein [Burkholderiales bacterium]|nr:conserved hypothetical protein [Burkholderiales bacterium]
MTSEPASPATVLGSMRRHASWWVFAALLSLQGVWSLRLANDGALQASPGAPPGATALQLASLDEPALAGYATSLYLQGFDAQAGALLGLRLADAQAIWAWLELAYSINPHSGYPLMLAVFDYAGPAHAHDEASKAAAEAHTPAPRPVAPMLLDLVERAYRADPVRHWRWLAHASYVARFSLHDDERALRYAQLLRDAPQTAQVPRWARELDSFVLRRRDAAEAQRALLGGLAFGAPGTDSQVLDRMAARLASPANDPVQN